MNGLKDVLYDLVVDIACGGMVLNDGYVVEGAWEQDKLLTLEDLIEILNSGNNKRFLDIELRYEEGTGTIKYFLRKLCANSGLKFDKVMINKMVKAIKEIAEETIILSDKNEQDLKEIKDKYNIICNDVMQYALFVERCLVVETEENEQL